MRTIQFALVGCGRIAERHAKHIQMHGKLVAVCDTDKVKAIQLAAIYGTVHFEQIDELLAAGIAIDVVVICTPNGLHAAQSILALNAGYHVLVEKPMAISSADCRKMIEASKKTGKQLFTVMQNRFNPPVMEVKKVLDSGAFGKIYSIQVSCFWNRNPAYYKDSWRGTAAMDGGSLYTQFSHFIDLLYWFFGEVEEVHSITQNAAHGGIIEFEDSGVALIRFSNGILGTLNYSVNSFAKNAEGSLTILAENGTVQIGGEYLNNISYQHCKDFHINTNEAPNTANDYGTYKGSMSNHGQVYESLINSLLCNKPFYAKPEEGFKTVELIERIYQSAMDHH